MIRETTYTGARKQLATLMDQVTDTREPVFIHRRCKEPVALVAADELAGWVETAHLLRSTLADSSRRPPVRIKELGIRPASANSEHVSGSSKGDSRDGAAQRCSRPKLPPGP